MKVVRLKKSQILGIVVPFPPQFRQIFTMRSVLEILHAWCGSVIKTDILSGSVSCVDKNPKPCEQIW